MAQTEFNQLLQTARDLNFASNKLLVIAGAKGSGKTDLVQKVSAQLSWPLVKVGKEVSERLLNLTVRQRRLKAEEVVADALDATGHRALCLDNTEVLFDTALAINPVNLLLNLSRNRLLVVAWNGHLESGSLVYAYPEHPEHFKGPANGFPVVSVTDEKLHLFLQP
jgi:hypothetical protein